MKVKFNKKFLVAMFSVVVMGSSSVVLMANDLRESSNSSNIYATYEQKLSIDDLIRLYEENEDFRNSINEWINFNITIPNMLQNMLESTEFNVDMSLLESISSENKDKVFITFNDNDILFKKFIYSYNRISLPDYDKHRVLMIEEGCDIKEQIIKTIKYNHLYLSLIDEEIVIKESAKEVEKLRYKIGDEEFYNTFGVEFKEGLTFIELSNTISRKELENLRDELGGDKEFYNILGVTFEEALNIEKNRNFAMASLSTFTTNKTNNMSEQELKEIFIKFIETNDNSFETAEGILEYILSNK